MASNIMLTLHACQERISPLCAQVAEKFIQLGSEEANSGDFLLRLYGAAFITLHPQTKASIQVPALSSLIKI